ncbi:MAG: glutathione S-transferase N-terminal domain-containing protein [Steroidobacteraceae bacterium]
MTQPTIRLYELVLENGRSASPFVWRSRYALAHKGLPFEPVPLGFNDLRRVLGGRFKTVPILEEGEHRIGDSWDIAEYLDRAHPDRAPIFTSAAERAMVRMFDAWFSIEILRRLLGLYVLDVHDAARPEDRAYFRQSREAWLKGATLESHVADRESRLPAVRDALSPLRQHLSRGAPFIGGDSPNYADYIALGGFHWVASVSTLPLLASDDRILCDWIGRGFDLYGGIGRDARMKPLAA